MRTIFNLKIDYTEYHSNSTMQNVGLNRNLIDKFYTKPSIARRCIDIVLKTINVNTTTMIVEPSAGGGAFVKILNEMGFKVLSYDIKPEYKDIIKADFLATDIPYKNILYIGNPPFGSQSSTARKFIKKCCENGSYICFILPKSFKKTSFQKSFDLSFHLIEQIDLPNNSFLINNIEHVVPCVFQIWEKRNYNRNKPIKHKPIGFSYVKKGDKPDLAIRRCGGSAGKITEENLTEMTETTNYFIKVINKKNIKKIVIRFSSEKFDVNNTVAAKSIAKSEITPKINMIIKELNKNKK